MAQFGGNKNPPWAQGAGGRPGQPGQAGTGAIDVPGLVGAFGAAAAAAGGPGGPHVFHQGGPAGLPPGLAGHLGVPGSHGPAVTLAAMASQPGVYPRPLGPGGFQGNPLLQQQQPPQVMLTQGPPPPQQPPPQQTQQPPPQQQGQQQASQRVFTGTVTKLHDNFGFVDEDVFFQTSVVKGQTPRVNDRVLVEAAFNANMPFKWNATRIQVLPNQNSNKPMNPNSSTSVTSTSTLNAHAFANPSNAPQIQTHQPPPPVQQRMNHNRNEAAFGSGNGASNSRGNEHGGGRNNESRMRQPSPPVRDLKRMSSNNDHRNRRDDRSNTRDRSDGGRDNRDRSRDKDRSNSRASPPTLSRKRSRSPRRTRSRSRSRSPPRRRVRIAPRYNVSVPKVSLNFPDSNVYDLKKRYSNMYVPSDFFMADHSWMKSFPVHDAFKIQYASTFHIFNKDQVESPLLSDAVYDPMDADHRYNAKVMLMAIPPPDVLIEKTCQLAESSATNRDNLVHPTRAIQFLVGTRGKNETLAIGGPWSPSLDGPNPESDPSVLIKTAIRVCRALTGIDLSNCTQWHKFLEINYRRQESSSKPARSETTVIFLPDIWSVMPTSDEHNEAKTLYEKALESKINPQPVKIDEPVEEQPKENEESKDDQIDNSEDPVQEGIPEKDPDEDGNNDETKADEEEDSGLTPTPHQDLDIKAMKVVELRQELEARGLDTAGLKAILADRLQKAIEDEKEKEETEAGEAENEASEITDEPATETENATEKMETESENVVQDAELMVLDSTNTVEKYAAKFAAKKEAKMAVVKELDEKQKYALKSAYKFPSESSILVHPHPKAKSGKFDCTVMSLSVLLDYRTEDNKENTFEVSLFAELFNEMLMRDSGFKLYKAICVSAEKSVETLDKSKTDENEKKSEEAKESDEKKTEEKKTEVEKPKTKVLTKDRDLLLACSYFDLGHCGYFETKDLEDILTTMNLSLSRAQIKKLVTKVTNGKDQQVNYRQFTDKPEDEELVNASEIDDEDLGKGFKAFLPKAEVQPSSDASTHLAEGMCSYRGSVVDVGKLLSQLKRSEKARSDTEANLKSALKNVHDLKEASEKHTSVKDKLQSEVKDLKKQLKRVEDDMKRSQTDSSKYYTILKDIYSKVHPAVNAPTSPTPSSKEIKKEEAADEINGKTEVEDDSSVKA